MENKSRTFRTLHASFVTMPFSKMLAEEAIDQRLTLGPVDRGCIQAQSEDEQSSATEAKGWSDLEGYEGQGARAYKRGADLEKP